MTIAASEPFADDRIRAVVCDLDGTLIDSERVFAEAARRVLARRGLALEPEFMATMQGTPGREALPRFRARYNLTDSVETLVTEYRQAFIEAAGQAPPVLMPGTLELLDWLEARSIPKAIATSSSREYVHSVFGPHGQLPRFEFVLTIDDVTQGKPHPEIFELAAARLGLQPRQVLVLEDSAAGVRAASAAGTRCVLVSGGGHRIDGIDPAVTVVTSLHAPELRSLLA